jgi:beta-glucosidase
MTLMGLGSTFDRSLGNAWGQTAGTESRAFMVTGLFGPQTDLDRLPNWGRNLTTTGEDPYLSQELVAAQINGMQGVGAMSQMKHFAVYNGQNQNLNTDIQDQPLHETYLTPYEGGFVDGKAAATMCSYQLFRDTSPYLPNTVSSITTPSPFSTGAAPTTWPLNESHFSCEQPLILTYILRDLWGSQAFVGSDYPATHSTSAILQGEDQEMPTQAGFFSATHVLTAGQQTDPTGSTCADATGAAVSCSSPAAIHVGGFPGAGCPA